MKNLQGFYFITNSDLSKRGLLADVELALKGGSRIVQFREKQKMRKDYIDELIAIKKLCKEYNALLIINDDAVLALEIDADGVHLGQEDNIKEQSVFIKSAGKILGISTSTKAEAIKAHSLGASYIALGHTYATKTKDKDYPPLGLDILKEVRGLVSLPIAAIGGISRDNAKGVIAAGANMICAISGSLEDGRIKDNVSFYTNLFT